jgi:pilus assembly protein Flp/PilA
MVRFCEQDRESSVIPNQHLRPSALFCGRIICFANDADPGVVCTIPRRRIGKGCFDGRSEGKHAASYMKAVEKMKTLIRTVLSFVREDEGATATEYAVMLAMIIIISIGAIGALGTKVSGMFANATAKMP